MKLNLKTMLLTQIALAQLVIGGCALDPKNRVERRAAR